MEASEDKNDNIFWQLAGRKWRNKMGAQMNESAAAPSNGNGTGSSSLIANDFARKQLEKLGWKEGEGLGKKRDGMATHIKVTKRLDEKGGLGVKQSSLDVSTLQSIYGTADGSGNGHGAEWWKGSVGDTLARLKNAKKSKKKDKKKSKTKKPKIFTDEELFQATGGKRFGMRAQTQQTAKWKRAESNSATDIKEKEALSKMEWDGMSAPKVLLSSPTAREKIAKKEKKRKRKLLESMEETEPDTTTTATIGEKQERKKRKTKDKKSNIISEEEETPKVRSDDKESKKKKKKRKQEKKKSKKEE